jgi:hypothetical protein
MGRRINDLAPGRILTHHRSQKRRGRRLVSRYERTDMDTRVRVQGQRIPQATIDEVSGRITSRSFSSKDQPVMRTLQHQGQQTGTVSAKRSYVELTGEIEISWTMPLCQGLSRQLDQTASIKRI